MVTARGSRSQQHQQTVHKNNHAFSLVLLQQLIIELRSNQRLMLKIKLNPQITCGNKITLQSIMHEIICHLCFYPLLLIYVYLELR